MSYHSEWRQLWLPCRIGPPCHLLLLILKLKRKFFWKQQNIVFFFSLSLSSIFIGVLPFNLPIFKNIWIMFFSEILPYVFSTLLCIYTSWLWWRIRTDDDNFQLQYEIIKSCFHGNRPPSNYTLWPWIEVCNEADIYGASFGATKNNVIEPAGGNAHFKW